MVALAVAGTVAAVAAASTVLVAARGYELKKAFDKNWYLFRMDEYFNNASYDQLLKSYQGKKGEGSLNIHLDTRFGNDDDLKYKWSCFTTEMRCSVAQINRKYGVK